MSLGGKGGEGEGADALVGVCALHMPGLVTGVCGSKEVATQLVCCS